MKTLLVVAFSLLFEGSSSAGTFTYLEHLKSSNQLICEKLVTAKQESSVDECVKKRDALAESNPNKNALVEIGKSGACVGSLFGVKAEEILQKSSEGRCSLSTLQGSAAPAQPAPPTSSPSQPAAATPPPPVTGAVSAPGFKTGDLVKVKWGESWWDAQVLEVKPGNKYYIKYDGYADSWNETVGTDRIKAR